MNHTCQEMRTGDLYETLFSESTDAMALCDIGQVILKINLSFTSLLGFTEEEAIGSRLSELFNQSLAEDSNPGQSPLRLTHYRVRVKNGTAKDISITARIVGESETLHLIVLNRDLDEIERVETELEIKNRRYEGFFMENTAPMWLVEPETGRFVEVNKVAVERYGYSAEQFRSMTIFDINRMSKKELLALMDKAARKGKNRFQFEHYLASGERLSVEVLTTGMILGGKRFVHSIMHDVTEKVIAEKALAEKTAELEQLFENAPFAIFLCDEYRTVLRVNEAAAGMFGYVVEDMTGRTIEELIVPEADQKRGLAFSDVVYLDQQVAQFDAERKRKDGSFLTISCIGFPLLLDGNTLGSYVIYQDITRRKNAERENTESRKLLETLFDAIPDPIVFKNPALEYVMANRAFEERSTLKLEAILGKRADEIHPRSLAKTCSRGDREVMRSLSSFCQTEVVESAAGRRIFETCKTPVLDETGGLKGILTISREATERLKAEAKILEMNQDLAEKVLDLNKAWEQTVHVLANASEARDAYTAGHQRRVAKLSKAIAGEMGMDETTVKQIELAALVHDIGKIEIPSEILSKPGRLSALEFQLIQTHSAAGYRILQPIEVTWPLAEIVYQHHERLDGTGYPRGLKGDGILLGSRIISVADTLEAMSSHRPYRAALGLDVAFSELEKYRGKRFDADAVDACLKVFEKGFSWEDKE
jgi:PAS domain S-box-containing protein/putative nucleotidyltransferase with HDIG domain